MNRPERMLTYEEDSSEVWITTVVRLKTKTAKCFSLLETHDSL
jgi:hypothetical protein